MKYCLAKFSKDWGDEFDVYGMSVFTEPEWKSILEFAKTTKYKPEWYFGTNEGWSDEPVQEYIDRCKVTWISAEAYDAISHHVGRDYGNFPDFHEWMRFAAEEEEEWG